MAKRVFSQKDKDLETIAAQYITDQVPTVEDALQGARDIIAEWVSEDIKARDRVRRHFEKGAVIASRLVKGKEEAAAKYRDYFEWSEPLKNCPSHRLLAMRRGEEEGFLRVSIAPEEERVVQNLEDMYVIGYGESAEQVRTAVKDSYKRLLQPGIETEFRNESKEKADAEAIRVFAENLRQLLLSSPLGEKGCWVLTLVFARAARLFVSMRVAICFITQPFTRTNRSDKCLKVSRKSSTW